MGCTSSKRIETVDSYRPAPTSFSVLDIYAIQEPWLKEPEPEDDRKPSHVPTPILEKLNAIEDAPRTWDEVSKELEDLKPKINTKTAPNTPPATAPSTLMGKPARRKSFSFHTLEELEARIAPKPTESKPIDPVKFGSKKFQSTKPTDQTTKTELKRVDPVKPDSRSGDTPKSLKDNVFILRDKQEREKEGKPAGFVKRDPLGDFEEISPPNGSNSVVLYTTSLGGVRRTYEDCNMVRSLMETHRIVFDERDVSLHGGFLNELKELLGEGVSVPRVFVKGRYIGGVDEVVHLNETGRLVRILNWARIERGLGRLGCEGCGGARFVPCLGCGGSCKVVVEGKKERCGECNENGLVHCPICV